MQYEKMTAIDILTQIIRIKFIMKLVLSVVVLDAIIMEKDIE